IEALRLEKLQTHDQLQDAMKSLEQQQQRLSKLSEICEQKDDVISKLQEALRNATRDRPATCSCGRRTEGDGDKEQKESGKRQRGETEEQGGGAAKKRVVLEEEIWRLQEVNNKKEETICELREREQLRRELEEEAEELKRKNVVLEQKIQELTDLDNCLNCDSVLSSLEREQKETARLQKENKALVNGIFQLQTEVTTMQTQLKQQTDTSNSLSRQVDLAKSRIQYLENQSKEEGQSSSLSVLHAAMEELKKKSQVEQQKFVQMSQQMKELQKEKRQLEEQLAHRNSSCVELRQEMENQRAEFSQQLQNLRAEVESEGRALQLRLEEERRHQLEEEVAGLQRVMLEKEQLLAESQQHTETLRRELHCLKEKLYGREEDEEKENQSARRPQGKRQEDVREPHLHRDAQDSSSPSRSNTADRKKLSKTVKRKRKSSEVEGLVFSENKRNRVKGRAHSNKLEDGMLQKIEELLQNSQSISKADPAPSTTVSRPRRLRKKLFKLDASSPLLDSPHTMPGGGEEDKESDHLIIRRQLRSNSCRK
ncbi:hypothetical protein ILYODFUR_019551, partial [Ilyodon furcidens]